MYYNIICNFNSVFFIALGLGFKYLKIEKYPKTLKNDFKRKT